MSGSNMSARPPSETGMLKNKWAGYFFVALLCFAVLPVFSQSFSYIPTPEWISSGYGPILAASVFAAVLFSILILRGLGEDQIGQSPRQTFGVIASPLFVALILYLSAFVGLPLFYTAVAGKHREMHVIVEDPRASRLKHCRGRIELRNMPFISDSLCGFSDEFRNGLKPGDELIVSGRGSWFGIFVRSASVAE